MKPNERYYIHIAVWIRKQLQGQLSDSERRELDIWIGMSEDNLRLYEQCLSTEGRKTAFDKLDSYDSRRAYDRIKPLLDRAPEQMDALTTASAPDASPAPVIRWRKWLPYAAAAAIVLAVLTWGIFQPNGFLPPADQNTGQLVDFAPAGNKASIQLSDGRRFELDEDRDRIIVDAKGLTYASGEHIAPTESATYASITTPRGGTYHLVLADGTEVTLNAGSTLTYPTTFTGDVRMVELRGEAFFDVSRAGKAFVVETRTHTVEVLGTRFNINAYDDEKWAKTTLVEGSVQLKPTHPGGSQSIILEPGTQGLVLDGDMTVSSADIDSELAWIRGRFDFDGKKLREVMREISRWYDVDVRYEGNVPDIEFFGGTFRGSSLATILSLLENSGLRYRLEADRTLIIGN